MAFKITNLANTEAPSSDYSYGKLKNNTGSNNGTPVNEQMMNDVLQFFQKLMDEGDVIPNELPENDYSGYQLFEALGKVIKPYKVITGFVDDNGFTVLENETEETVTFNKVQNGVYDLDITGNAYTSNKTAVLPSNSSKTEQGDTTVIQTGSELVSTSKVRVTCFAFANITGTPTSASGVNVGTSSFHPDPIHVEIRIYD